MVGPSSTRGSAMGVTVDMSSWEISQLFPDSEYQPNLLSESMYSRTSAEIPATWGVAMDVPDL